MTRKLKRRAGAAFRATMVAIYAAFIVWLALSNPPIPWA